MGGLTRPPRRPVEFLGDSLKVVTSWPLQVKKSAGDDLAIVQYGGYPAGCEALPDIGAHVHAIRVRHDKEQYRVIWIAQLCETIFVLHAFHKKSKRGKETPKSDKDLAKDRLKALRQRLLQAPASSRRH